MMITSPMRQSFVEPFGKALALLFLPYLSAFLLQSNHLLRTYIAVLVAPVPTPSPPEPEQTPNSVDTPRTTSGHNWRVIPAILVLSILSLLQCSQTQLRQVVAEAFKAVNKYFLYTCLFISVTGVTIQIVYPNKNIIHRTPDGKYITVREGLGLAIKQHPVWILSLILSIAFFACVMVASVSDTNKSFPIAVVTMTYVASATMIGKVPLREFIKVYSFFVVILVLVLFISIQHGNTRTYQLEEDEVWSTNLFKDLRHLTFLPAALGSFCSGPLIATMLRFDFNRFCVAEPHGKLSYKTAPHPFDPNVGKGVIVPESLPVKFSKPYYTLTLFTWSMIRITTLALCIATGFPFTSPYDACTFGILLEVPIMTIVILLFATRRGEARALWCYREVWVKKPLTVKEAQPVVTEGELVVEKEDESIVKGDLLLLGEDKVVSANEDLMV